MGAGKNKAHRKNRISKHVVDAQTKRESVDTTAKPQPGVPVVVPPLATTTTTTAPKKRKSKKNRHQKDPKEAASYLSSWKHRESGTNWKFNKNTQSWLIRHMYESDKMEKNSFALMLEYLTSGDERMRVRVRDDATKRAIRYKEYEKKAEQNKESNTDTPNVGDATEKNAEDEKTDEEHETARWNALNEHDKRKEYKRARKLLDTLKE